MTNIVLDVRNLSVEFTSDEKRVLAVNNISFQLKRGQTLGIVGESGSGKSVTSLAVMGLMPPSAKVTGEIYFKSKSGQSDDETIDLLTLKDREKPSYRGGKIAMIFQEPMTSLNPVYTIGFQLIEAILQHQELSTQQAIWKASERLQQVQLLPTDEKIREQFREEFRKKSDGEPQQKEIDDYINQQKRAFLSRYPHQLSGGQLQRVMIAMAISCEPDILIADEPTTALDVTVQADILNLLRTLRDNLNMSLIFISHDLGVIAEIADTVAVMYQGEIRETKNVLQIFSNPEDPYTKALLACRPSLERHQERLPIVSDFMDVVTDKDGKIVEIKEKSGSPDPNQKSQVITENPQSPSP
ncbi:ABC transporter ATP-binding protein, partial [Limnofasciculus baicalensis]